MKLAALVATLLLAPGVLAAPPRAPELVTIAVGHDRAMGFVAGDGLVVTAAHVLGDEAITADGRPAAVIRVDRRDDLALLRVSGVRGGRPRIGGGDDTTLLGRPAPVARRIRASVDGGPRRPVLELRAQVAVGDSGAPVIGADGRVAGVVFARSRTREDVAYAVDGRAVAELLRRRTSTPALRGGSGGGWLRIVEAAAPAALHQKGVGRLAVAIRPISDPKLHVHLISGSDRVSALRHAESRTRPAQPTPPPYKQEVRPTQTNSSHSASTSPRLVNPR